MTLDLADLKPSVYSFLMTGLFAVAFILLFKYLVNAYQNPVTDYLRDFANAI